MNLYNEYVKNIKYNGFGIAEGCAKDIITLINLYDISKDNLYKDKIDEIIKDILLKKSNQKLYEIGLWDGVLGLSLAIDIVSSYFKTNEYNRINERIYDNLKPIIEYWLNIDSYNLSLDYLNGFSGIILYIGNHSIAKRDNKLIESTQKKIVELLDESIMDKFIVSKKSDLYYLDSKYNEDENYIILGLAHGITGFLISINSIMSLADYNTRKKIVSFNYYIEKLFLDNFFDKQKKLQVPLSLKVVNQNSYKVFSNKDLNINELSWCYGIIGIGIYVFKISGSVELKEKIAKEINKEISKILIKNSDNGYDKDLCICHGYSAIFYFYNFMCSSGEKSHNFIKYLKNSLNNKDYKNDFLVGIEGIVLTINALEANKRFLGDFLLGY